MCNNPVHKKNRKGDWIQFPCGGCMGCRVDKLLLWTARCQSEYVKYRSAFVTFTYSDLFLRQYCFKSDSQLYPSINRFQFHKFIDNLRHKVNRLADVPLHCTKKFKLFACSEYGDERNRPHYHALFFGLDFHDFKRIFEEVWPFGNVYSLPILDGGIRYVVDYFTKQLTGKLAEKAYDDKGIERPFTTASQGLGLDFFLEHAEEISKTGAVKIGSRSILVPSYFSNLLLDFSEGSLDSREQLRLKRYHDEVLEAKHFGFPSIEDFRSYKRQNNEKILVNRYRSKGSPVRSCFEYSRIGSNLDLLSQVQNILREVSL